ncbi:MAG: hypothetical protein QXM22_01270 [Candidatus Bathyarchaeia archaeon]
MSLDYVLVRNNYKPSKIKFLLVAESPPAFEGYFYLDSATGRDYLFKETMKAIGLFPEDKRMQRGFDKRPLLKEFQRRGFFLIDVSYKPVNSMTRRKRRLVIREAIPRLVAETVELNPERIIIVKASIYDDVKDALEKAGFAAKILNKRTLPFPSHGHQKVYRQMLRGFLHHLLQANDALQSNSWYDLATVVL